jgi:hypothetical protein
MGACMGSACCTEHDCIRLSCSTGLERPGAYLALDVPEPNRAIDDRCMRGKAEDTVREKRWPE